MRNILSSYPTTGEPIPIGAEDRSIVNNLRRQKKNLEEQLEKVNAALSALEKQPEVAKLLETIIKVM
jgi:hypothetical protein